LLIVHVGTGQVVQAVQLGSYDMFPRPLPPEEWPGDKASDNTDTTRSMLLD